MDEIRNRLKLKLNQQFKIIESVDKLYQRKEVILDQTLENALKLVEEDKNYYKESLQNFKIIVNKYHDKESNISGVTEQREIELSQLGKQVASNHGKRLSQLCKTRAIINNFNKTNCQITKNKWKLYH